MIPFIQIMIQLKRIDNSALFFHCLLENKSFSKKNRPHLSSYCGGGGLMRKRMCLERDFMVKRGNLKGKI